MITFQNKRILIGLGLLVIFSFIVIIISLQYGLQHEKRELLTLNPDEVDLLTKEEIVEKVSNIINCDAKVHLFQLLPIVAFIGLIIGIFEYYLLYELINRQEQSLQKNAKIIFRFLSAPEKKIIKYLIDNKGCANQYELSHLKGLNKFKTHRIINNLEDKGVLIKNRVGKVNKISLNNEIHKFLEN